MLPPTPVSILRVGLPQPSRQSPRDPFRIKTEHPEECFSAGASWSERVGVELYNLDLGIDLGGDGVGEGCR